MLFNICAFKLGVHLLTVLTVKNNCCYFLLYFGGFLFIYTGYWRQTGMRVREGVESGHDPGWTRTEVSVNK